ncbi:hypothetical protein [Nocardia sp. NPDC057030]|uniref:hypothetical protein n=1 Tax=unclassified Nocardia TaxID=2637762 RepID=UPI00363DF6C2
MGAIRHRGWMPILAGALMLAGCSNPSDVEKIGDCGGIHFPDNARVVAHDSEMPGLSDEIVEVVAELPRADLDAFKTKSKLGQFQAGVPSDWKSQYWRSYSAADSLRADIGNEHYSDWDGKHGRQVVVHDNGGDINTVFARGLC